MLARGAPLIGVTAAYGMASPWRKIRRTELKDAGLRANAARPTAVNLAWAVTRMQGALANVEPESRADAAMKLADEMADEDVETNASIGRNGADIIAVASGSRRQPGPHPDALQRRLARHRRPRHRDSADYEAHERGINLEVWSTRHGRAIRRRADDLELHRQQHPEHAHR